MRRLKSRRVARLTLARGLKLHGLRTLMSNTAYSTLANLNFLLQFKWAASVLLTLEATATPASPLARPRPLH